MNRHGFALLLVLWLLVALTSLVGVSVADTRSGTLTSLNRQALTRAGWAREACLSILLARYPTLRTLDRIDLGVGTWCRTDLDDPGRRLNLNRASREALTLLLEDPVLAARLVAARPFPAVEAVERIPGMDSLTERRLLLLATVRGAGRVNLNLAPVEVLRAVPGLGADGAAAVLGLRRGQPLSSIDGMLGALPTGIRGRVMAVYPAFLASVTLEANPVIATLEGHASTRDLVARETVTLVPAGSRLAVIRREVE